MFSPAYLPTPLTRSTLIVQVLVPPARPLISGIAFVSIVCSRIWPLSFHILIGKCVHMRILCALILVLQVGQGSCEQAHLTKQQIKSFCHLQIC
jgi:hypothetical protein